jgi:hypothetical protein
MNPTGMVAGQYEGAYLCFYTDAGTRRGFLLDPVNPQGIFFLDQGYDAAAGSMNCRTPCSCSMARQREEVGCGRRRDDGDLPQQELGHAQREFPLGQGHGRRLPGDAQGRRGPLHRPGADRHGGAAGGLPQRTVLRGQLPARHAHVASADAFELHAGFEAQEWQVQVESTQPVQAVVLATTVKETA